MTAPFNPQYPYPPGIILMWGGDIQSIPEGFALCDGNNGTPNLMNRFVTSAALPTIDTPRTVGADSFSLDTIQMRAHTHNYTTTSDGEHNHHVRRWPDITRRWDTRLLMRSTSANQKDSQPAGSHVHSMTVENTGGGGSIDNIPPYTSILYIQKL